MRLPSIHVNYKVHHERDLGALSRLASLLLCGLALTGGFLFAARQHFAAIQYGYKTEELRREHQQLLQAQRRLLLEKEEVTAPGRLEPAAREIGLRPLQPGQIAVRKDDAHGQSHPAVLINAAASLSR
jgi:hypothetical protein